VDTETNGVVVAFLSPETVGGNDTVSAVRNCGPPSGNESSHQRLRPTSDYGRARLGLRPMFKVLLDNTVSIETSANRRFRWKNVH
jgi:hypothetical protein